MTRYLDRWGFDAVAVSINTSGATVSAPGRSFSTKVHDSCVFSRRNGTVALAAGH